MNLGVHVAHCCGRHGCKYGERACPVATGGVDQEYPCEYCLPLADAERAVRDAQDELEWSKKMYTTSQV